MNEVESRIGPYEVLARIGAGGMGEVWRARDPRIGREVALKLLPASLATEPDRLRRFEQEAKATGTLNHPNLVTLYELGTNGGAPFIAMELLEGETLRDKLGEGTHAHPLPYRKSIELAAQMATGLAAAHEKGVVHRDLKPENVFVTRDGRLKILDFGLAKLRIPIAADPVDDRTQQKATNPGTVMGTAGYMSPEQVRGHDVDHRADIFAFGAILYEMLSGRRAFRRDSSVETMNAILNEDPPEIAASTAQHIAPGVDRIIRRCLEKSPEERFQSARDLAFALEAMSGSSISHEHVAASAPPRRIPFAAAAAAIALVSAALGALVAVQFARRAPVSAPALVSQQTFDTGLETAPSIAPDGKTFVFVKGVAPRRQIFLQRIDGRSAIPLSKSPDDDDHAPAFSPDGSQIAFRSERDGGGVFVMGATGESVRRLTAAGFNPAWSADGSEIVFSSEDMLTPTSRNSVAGISMVNVASGAVRKIESSDAMQPRVSPNRKRIAYWGLPPNGGQRDIYTVAVDGGAKTVVPATNDAALDWNPVWAPDGESIFFVSDRGGTTNLWRLPIDEESGKPRGAPQPVLAPATQITDISLSRDGRHLMYVSLSITEEIRHATVDAAAGKVVVNPKPALSGSMLLRTFEPSPDGQWIAFTTEGRQEDVYVMRVDGSDLRQLTNDPARDRGVAWSPDGSRIFFYSARSGTYDAWSIRADGSELAQRTKDFKVNFPMVSPDGQRMAFLDLEVAYIAQLGASPATKSEALPPLPGMTDVFFPTGWSPDGTKLVGRAWLTPQARFFVYSIADRTYRPLGTFGSRRGRLDFARWIDDHRVLIAAGNHLYIVDVQANTRRDLGPAETAVPSRNGRYVAISALRSETDIWQMTLPDAR